MTARHLPDGTLRPWAADYLAGLREVARLKQDLDLDLTRDEIAALGQAIDDQRWNGYQGPVYGPDWGQVMPPELDQLRDQQTREVKYWLEQYRLKDEWCTSRGHRHARNESCNWETAQNGQSTSHNEPYGKSPGQEGGGGGGPGPGPQQDQAQEQGQDGARAWDNRYAQDPRDGTAAAQPQGQDDHHSGEQTTNRDRNREFDRKKYWERITRDYPDQEWS